MNEIIQYFENISSAQRTIWLAVGLFFFYVIEYLIPYIRFNYFKAGHAAVNLVFTATTALVNLALAFIMVFVSDYMAGENLGLLHMIELPVWLFIIIGLLLMDFIGAWIVHYLQHKVKWMWKFHLVHHTDNYVDVSTANRHHPGESVFRFAFTILAVLITGAPIWLIMIYQTLSAAFSQFNHANINLPSWIDNAISFVFVSPNMHKVHHHYLQPYTDANYANIFSVWDRLFGTFSKIDREKIIYGIDTHMEKKSSDHLGTLLTLPFRKYRPAPGSKFGDIKKPAK